jgi:hypothetical protein
MGLISQGTESENKLGLFGLHFLHFKSCDLCESNRALCQLSLFVRCHHFCQNL